MIYEVLEGVHFDIPRLIEHYEKYVKPLPMHVQPGFGGNGGWSVLSSNGSYLDGWFLGAMHYMEDGKHGTFDVEEARKMGVAMPWHFQKETEICHGYLKEVIDTIRDLGFNPSRARIGFMAPHGDTRWHRDAAGNEYAVRLHIPIITHASVRWCTPEGEAHLPADGRAYLVGVNQLHLMKNPSEFPRIHLLMDVKDTQNISRYFKFNPLKTRT